MFPQLSRLLNTRRRSDLFALDATVDRPSALSIDAMIIWIFFEMKVDERLFCMEGLRRVTLIDRPLRFGDELG